MRALAATILLGGCVGGSGLQPAPSHEFRLDAMGIEVIGTGRRIDFGRAQAGVTETMSRIRGRAPEPEECPASGAEGLAWDDGLILVFVDGAFSGWQTREAARSAIGETRFGAACGL